MRPSGLDHRSLPGPRSLPGARALASGLSGLTGIAATGRLPLPSRDDVRALLAQPLLGPRTLPIRDRSPDPGLFGPDSVTWRVMREPALILGGGRALLMQAAHPLVAQGAIDHSTYATDPWGRLNRTTEWVTQVAFGTTAEAERATGFVNRLHSRVSGDLPGAHATRRMRRGRRYSAIDPRLLLWVHLSFVDTMLVAHDALVGGLTPRDRDAFVEEWRPVGRLLGIPERLLWRTQGAMRSHLLGAIDGGEVAPGAGSRLVARTVLRPPLPSGVLRPAFDAGAFVSVGLLPAAVRRGYGITWTPAHAATHRALCLWLRTTGGALPGRLKRSPVWDFAVRRSEGRLAGLAVLAS
ncbi:MAG: oxygenase MpaB family protein [Candidatus Dormibacteria bacterium]